MAANKWTHHPAERMRRSGLHITNAIFRELGGMSASGRERHFGQAPKAVAGWFAAAR